MSSCSNCWIPGCPTALKSYSGPRVSVFSCKPESEKFAKWQAVIPIDWTKTTKPKVLRICERHFKPEDVLRVRTLIDQRGIIHELFIKGWSSKFFPVFCHAYFLQNYNHSICCLFRLRLRWPLSDVGKRPGGPISPHRFPFLLLHRTFFPQAIWIFRQK